MLASQLVLSCIEHMEQALHISSNLRSYHNAEMIFDPSESEFDMNVTFPREDWSATVYSEIEKELLHNILGTRGFGLKIVMFVNSDHAGVISPVVQEQDSLSFLTTFSFSGHQRSRRLVNIQEDCDIS